MSDQRFIHKEYFHLNVSRGVERGAQHIHKFGANPELGTSFETVWVVGGQYQWPEASNTLTISSTSADDVSTSFGASNIIIQGLDANRQPIQETLSLNGTNTVTTVNDYFRINRMYVDDLGSTANNATNLLHTNVGDITAVHNQYDYTVAQIEANLGQTQLGLYSPPAGYCAYVHTWGFSISNPSGTNIDGSGYLLVRENENKGFRIADELILKDQAAVIEYTYPVKFNGTGLDFEVRAKSTSGTPPVTTHFDILLIKDEQ